VSDVVAVALISAGSSLLGASTGALTTYMVSLRSSETAIKTAKSQHEVELARIEAENERLRRQHDEEERRNRQATYHRAVTALQRIYGLEGDDEYNEEIWSEWRQCRSGIQIFGSPKAFNAIDRMQEVLTEKPADTEDLSAWDEEFRSAAYAFIEVVREDVRKDQDEAVA
jgi:hypothetical protein